MQPTKPDPLQSLLAPHDAGDFLRTTLGRSPLHVPGPADKFTALFDWERLSALLNRKHPASASLRLIRDEVNYVYSKGPDTLRAVLQQLRDGATLVLENIDRYEPSLATLLDALSDQLGIATHLNLYLSAPGRQGYPLHYDHHDFLILQLSGHKRWEIFPSTPEALGSEAQRAQAPPPPESSRLHHWLLQPGDLLYLPRGYWHRALAEEQHSLHLTLGLYPPTGEQLLHWLLGELREDPLLQGHLPVHPKPELPTRAGQASPWAAQLTALQARLETALQAPDLLLRFHQACYRDLERRQAFALPAQLISDPVVLERAPGFSVRQVPRYLVQQDDGTLALNYPKHTLSFPAAAEPLLRHLLSRDEVASAALEQAFPTLTRRQISQWLLPLVQAGLLVPHAQA